MKINLYLCSLGALCLSTLSHAGIYEGNPGLTVSLSADAELLSAEAWVDEITLVGCDGDERGVVVGETVDLIAGLRVEVPGGDWCEVEVGLLDLTIALDSSPISWLASEDAVVVLDRRYKAPRAAEFRGAVFDRDDDFILRAVYGGNPPTARGFNLHGSTPSVGRTGG